MEEYRIGQILEEYKGTADQTMFDISDDGALLITTLHSPSEFEV